MKPIDEIFNEIFKDTDMPLEHLEIERKTFDVMDDGTYEMTLADVINVEMGVWNNDSGGWDPNKKQPGIACKFSTDEGQTAYKRCTCKFGRLANLTKMLKSMFGNKEFEAVAGSDAKIMDKLNNSIGQKFLINIEKIEKGEKAFNNIMSISPMPAGKRVALKDDDIEDFEPPKATAEDIPF